MKAIITLLFISIFGAIALANTEAYVKVYDIEMGVILGGSTICSHHAPQNEVGTEKGIARLYKLKNARVKNALTFSAIYTKSTLA